VQDSAAARLVSIEGNRALAEDEFRIILDNLAFVVAILRITAFITDTRELRSSRCASLTRPGNRYVDSVLLYRLLAQAHGSNVVADLLRCFYKLTVLVFIKT
jgi:hypothetical protein